MSILLSYSPPEKNLNSRRQDGISLYSDHIHQQLLRIFPNQEVLYHNAQDNSFFRRLRNHKVDYFFGISHNFHSIARYLKPEVSCLLSVNENALMRRAIRDLSERRGLPSSSFDPHDGYESNLKETSRADYILGIGGWSVFQSYRYVGFPIERLFVTAYPYWQKVVLHQIRSESSKILMFPGYLCTRKGMDYVESIVEFLRDHYPGFKLKLVGFVAYSDWSSRISDLCRRFPENIEFLETRIQYGSKEWLQLASDTAFAIFPSHEEGLAGCAMDIINLGIPLIHSSKVGIEYQHSTLIDVDFERDDWQKGISRIIEGGAPLWNEISQAQNRAAFHLDPKQSGIGRALERISHNYLWPKTDLGFYETLAPELHFLGKPKGEFSYRFSNRFNTEIDIGSIGKKFDLVDSALLLITILEKYTKFDSASMKIDEGSQLSIDRYKLEEKKNTAKLELFVREYLPSGFDKLPSKKWLVYLFSREYLCSFIYISRYKLKRLLNITRIKIRVEKAKLFSQ